MKPHFFLITIILILAACASPTITSTPQPVAAATQTRETMATATVTPVPIATSIPSPDISEEHYIYGVAWSPNGMRIAVKVLTGIEIYDANSLELISAIKTPVQYYQFTFDGIELATSGNNGALELWEVESGKLLQTINFEMGITNVFTLNSKKDLLATNEGRSSCYCVHLLNVKTGKFVYTLKQNIKVFEVDDFNRLEFLQDDKFILAWRWGTDAHVWRIEDRAEIYSIRNINSTDGRPNKWLISVTTAPKTNRIAMLFQPIPRSGDHTPPEIKTLTPSPQPRVPEIIIKDFSENKGDKLQQLNLLVSNAGILAIRFIEDGNVLILSSEEKIFFWDINKEQLIREIKLSGLGAIYNPAGTKAIKITHTKNYRDTIQVWDIETGKLIKSLTR